MMKLRIATRKSALALAQTTMAAEEIVAANRLKNLGESQADLNYELVSMMTEGDRRLDKTLASFGGKGVFIKELEIALLEGRADIAVHSLKDMPAEVLPEFKLAAVLKREDPRDAFLARGGASGMKFMELPSGAKVGTGSVRRVVQLKALRPDLEYVPIRGNIQTRISKLAELDGVVLAAAGLKRMGLADHVTEYFPTNLMLPASGQGILAIETLNESHGVKPEVSAVLAQANDVDTYCVAVAEMAFLKALDAGCQFPVASFAEWENGFFDESLNSACEKCRRLRIRGIYWDESSRRLIRAELLGDFESEPSQNFLIEKSKRLGFRLAEEIKKQMCCKMTEM